MAYLWTVLLPPTLLASLAVAGGISPSITRPIFATLPVAVELTTVAESTFTSTVFVTVRPLGYTSSDDDAGQSGTVVGGKSASIPRPILATLPVVTEPAARAEAASTSTEFVTVGPSAYTSGNGDAGQSGTDSAGSSTNGDTAVLTVSVVTATHPPVAGAVKVPSSIGLGDSALPSGSSSGVPTASTLFDVGAASSSDAALSSTSDPLAIGPSSTITSGGSSTASSSSTRDPLAIGTGAASGTTASPGSVSTQPPSSASGFLAVQPSLAPCAVDNPLANEDCRAHLASNCTRKAYSYPTCAGGECVCRANTCARAADCTKNRQCFDDEEARCKEQPPGSPNSPGVCECVPRVDGCMSRPRPHEFCDGEIDCSNERHRDIYPLFAQCVTEDPWRSYPRGRCMCRRVDCTYAHDEKEDNLSCLDLIWCHNGTNKVPHCNGKYDGNKNGPDDGYCLCPGNLP